MMTWMQEIDDDLERHIATERKVAEGKSTGRREYLGNFVCGFGLFCMGMALMYIIIKYLYQ